MRRRVLLDDIGLGSFPAGTLASSELGARKPDPDYFARALRQPGRPVQRGCCFGMTKRPT